MIPDSPAPAPSQGKKLLRLAFFDLDGTLKQARDPYVYLHKQLGTWEASQAFFRKGLAGELDNDEWLRLDAALWKGTSRARIEALFQQNPYLPGALESIAALKAARVRIALVSTGLLLHAKQVQAELGLDWIVANEILFEGQLATGEARAHPPEGGKARVVGQLQAQLGVDADECLAVGDGASDADMFPHVRLGVAINPSSDRVRAAADLVLEEPDLRPLVPAIRKMVPGWIPT